MLKKALTGAAAAAMAALALLGVEVLIARAGERPPPGPAIPADSPAGPPGAPVDSVVWLGDSTAAGLGASTPAGSLPEQAAAALGRPVRLTVLAHSGDRVADVLNRQVPRVAQAHPTVVFVSVGANDVTHLTSRGGFRRDYARMVSRLPGGARLVLLGVPDMGAPPRLPQSLRALAGWRGRSLDDDIRGVAFRTARATYVDIGGRTGPSFRSHPTRYFAPDRFHPNDAGYGLWARAVADVVTPSGRDARTP